MTCRRSGMDWWRSIPTSITHQRISFNSGFIQNKASCFSMLSPCGIRHFIASYRIAWTFSRVSVSTILGRVWDSSHGYTTVRVMFRIALYNSICIVFVGLDRALENNNLALFEFRLCLFQEPLSSHHYSSVSSVSEFLIGGNIHTNFHDIPANSD